MLTRLREWWAEREDWARAMTAGRAGVDEQLWLCSRVDATRGRIRLTEPELAALVDGQWKAAVSAYAQLPDASLHPDHRAASLAYFYDSELASGGHVGYFEHGGEEDGVAAVAALRALGANGHALILEEAIPRRALDEMRDLDAHIEALEPPLIDLLRRHVAEHHDTLIEIVSDEQAVRLSPRPGSSSRITTAQSSAAAAGVIAACSVTLAVGASLLTLANRLFHGPDTGQMLVIWIFSAICVLIALGAPALLLGCLIGRSVARRSPTGDIARWHGARSAAIFTVTYATIGWLADLGGMGRDLFEFSGAFAPVGAATGFVTGIAVVMAVLAAGRRAEARRG